MTTPSLKTRLRVAQLISFALTAGIVLFMGVTYFLISTDRLTPDSSEVPLISYLPYAAVLFSIPLAAFVSRKYFSSVDRSLPFVEKIGLFQTGLIVKLAIYEGSALLAIVISMKLGSVIHLAAPLISLVLMILSFPSVSRVDQLIGLTDEEKNEMI